MKNYFFLIFILTVFVKCSDNKTDIENLNDFELSKGWRTEIIKEKIDVPFFEKKAIGKVSFLKDEKVVSYFIFESKNEDTEPFYNSKIKYYRTSSCINIGSKNKEENFHSFHKDEYYFLLRMCHNCKLSEDCKELSKKLFNDNKLNFEKLPF